MRTTEVLPPRKQSPESSLKNPFSDILTFSKAILDFQPFPYQEDFLKDNGRRLSIRAGRQIGKTTCTAIKAVYKAITHPKQQILIIAPSQRQSGLLFRKIKEFVQASFIIQEYISRETMTMLFFKNNSEIHVLPAGYEGSTIRGFSPSMVVIDEAAFIKDEVFTAIEPSLAATNGSLILLSTPFGRRGKFYQSFHNKEFSNYHINSSQNPLITKEFLENEKTTMSDMEFKQEYEGEFMEEADTFFNHELVLSCVDEGITQKDTRDTGKDYFLGVDAARYGNDETVYIIGELDNGCLKITKSASTQKLPVTDIIGRVKDLHKEFNFRHVFMDESGLGGGAVDVLLEAGIPLLDLRGEHKGITFTLQNKQEMYKNLKLLMNQQRIKYPAIKRLVMQLTDLQYQYTSSGGLSLHHPDGGHDDYCFVGGTLVLTDRGQVRIEQIKRGDRVLTRQGFASVVGLGSRFAAVIRRLGLCGTPDHPIITSLGNKKLKYVSASDKIYVWNAKQSRIEESNTTAIPTAQEDNYEFITGHTQPTFQKPYTDKYGKTITALYKKDTSFITKTATHLTTPLTILNVCPEANTNQNTAKPQKENNNHEKISHMPDSTRFFGTNHQQAEHGTKNIMQKYRWHSTKNTHTTVPSAIKNTSVPESKKQSIALPNVTESFSGHREKAKNTNEDVVQRVYNLKIAGCPEYFANNILVHNCDALALVACGLREFVKPLVFGRLSIPKSHPSLGNVGTNKKFI